MSSTRDSQRKLQVLKLLGFRVYRAYRIHVNINLVDYARMLLPIVPTPTVQ